MAITFLDPTEVAELRALYVSATPTRDERLTEMWDGVEVVPPRFDDEHQDIRGTLGVAAYMTLESVAGARAYMGVNVSDRAEGWLTSYRIPDVLAYLPANPAVNHGTHWQGGPDFLVEILSPGEDPYAKFDFYAAVATREILLVFRDPWAMELHHLRGDRFELSGRSDLDSPAVLRSAVLPLTFQLQGGNPRPVIALAHTTDGRTWTA
ncbi:MAG: Uma2 family endonuclease [Fimbriiglobus sp.]